MLLSQGALTSCSPLSTLRKPGNPAHRLIYSGIQIGEIRTVLGDGRRPGQLIPMQWLTATIPVVLSIAQVAFIVLCWYLWKDFGWRIFKVIGGSRDLRKRYLHYQLFVAMLSELLLPSSPCISSPEGAVTHTALAPGPLEFDFFVFCAYCIQLVMIVLTGMNAERVITIIAPIFSLVVLVLAWWSVRHENRTGMYLFMLGLSGALTYFSYKIYRIWEFKDGLYKEVYRSLTIFSILSILLLVITYAIAVRCLLNFGRGLRAAIERITTARMAGHRAGASSGNVLDKAGLPMTGRDGYIHHRLSID